MNNKFENDFNRIFANRHEAALHERELQKREGLKKVLQENQLEDAYYVRQAQNEIYANRRG